MCGISGAFGLVDIQRLKRMIRVLQSRGPDASALKINEAGRYMLGHNRLAIIDLQERANQPMSCVTDEVDLVFNGEIYNFKDVRNELEARGYEFQTQSDTEVVLLSYLEFGCSCFSMFKGMFAVAIVDKRTEPYKYLLARDPFGVKPLYYTLKSEGLIFASQVNALAIGSDTTRINSLGVECFKAFGSIYQPQTIYSGIYSVPSGAVLFWTQGNAISTESYWVCGGANEELSQVVQARTPQQNVEAIGRLVNDAVKNSLVSDTPIAVMLSGGVDSVSIATVASKMATISLEGYHLKAFDSGDNDESNLVEKVAKDLSIPLHIVTLTDPVEEAFWGWIESLDQPSADGFNTWLLTKSIQDTHKVALSGCGGDELFAGYPHHRARARYKVGSLPFSDYILALMNDMRPNRYSLGAIQRFGSAEAKWRVARSLSNKSMVGSNKLHQLLSSPNINQVDQVSELQVMDIDRYLKNTLLVDQDIMAMSNSVEVRPALLDKDLADYCIRVPADQKISPELNKPLLINALNQKLLTDVASATKRGFELPYVGWMKGALAPLFTDLISRAPTEFFRPEVVRKELMKLEKRRPDFETWAIGVFCAWWQTNVIGANYDICK